MANFAIVKKLFYSPIHIFNNNVTRLAVFYG